MERRPYRPNQILTSKPDRIESPRWEASKKRFHDFQTEDLRARLLVFEGELNPVRGPGYARQLDDIVDTRRKVLLLDLGKRPQ